VVVCRSGLFVVENFNRYGRFLTTNVANCLVLNSHGVGTGCERLRQPFRTKQLAELTLVSNQTASCWWWIGGLSF